MNRFLRGHFKYLCCTLTFNMISKLGVLSSVVVDSAASPRFVMTNPDLRGRVTSLTLSD